MKVRLIVLTQDLSLYKEDEVLDYINTCCVEIEGMVVCEYAWDFSTVEGDFDSPALGKWYLRALDINIQPSIEALKGEVQVVFLSNKTSPLPLVEAQRQVMEIVLRRDIDFLSPLMHLPDEFEDVELQGYSFAIPELRHDLLGFYDWLAGHHGPQVSVMEMSKEAFEAGGLDELLKEFAGQAEDFGFGIIDANGHDLDYVHSRDKDKPKH